MRKNETKMREWIVRTSRILAAAIGGAVLLGATAFAGAPVAVVEGVAGGRVGVEFMDYLNEGQVIKLEPGSSIVIGYMRSCVHEKIAGGVITIGAEQSEIAGGSIERTKVDCDAGKMALTSQQNELAAGFIERDGASGHLKIRRMPKTQLTLYGSSPIVAIDGGGTAAIESLGGSGERLELHIGAGRGESFYDLARDGRSLTPGAVYVVSVGERHVVFRIDRNAAPGSTPIIGRLIAFEAVR
jgi:hypothetical protein